MQQLFAIFHRHLERVDDNFTRYLNEEISGMKFLFSYSDFYTKTKPR